MHWRNPLSVFLAAILFFWLGQTARASSSPYAKNQVVFPDEPFEKRQYSGTTNMGWIKFTIPKEAGALGPVTYQDSRVYQLHYDFVTRHLDPFIGIGPEEFEAISLYERGQQLILGAVITPPQSVSLHRHHPGGRNTIRSFRSLCQRGNRSVIRDGQSIGRCGPRCDVLLLPDL